MMAGFSSSPSGCIFHHAPSLSLDVIKGHTQISSVFIQNVIHHQLYPCTYYKPLLDEIFARKPGVSYIPY